MSERLIPYNEIDSRELAKGLNEAVAEGHDMLLARNILGPIERYYGSQERGVPFVEKGQRETASGELGHYAILHATGDIVGAASLFPHLPLRRQYLPIQAGAARRLPVVSHELPHARPNIHAWTNGDNEVLSDAYQQLAELAGQPHYESPVIGKPTTKEPFNITWTFEPSRSPKEIHEAIVAKSGLEKVKTARFDDGEDGHSIPPKGTLYAQLRSDWHSSHGKMKELRTGRHSFLVRMKQSEEEMMGSNPRAV